MYDQVESGISGLGDLMRALEASERFALAGTTTEAATTIQRAKSIARGLLARRRQYLGDVREDEIKDLVPTPRTLFARRRTAAGASGANVQYDFFHKGVQDEATNLGYASGTLSEYHTNLRKDGRLPQLEVFVANGISFEFPDNVAIADWREIQLGQVEWRERSGTEVLPLGQVREMPPLYTLETEYGADDETDRNVRAVGPKFVFKRPLFIIRGANTRTDDGFLRVTHHAGFTWSAETLWTCRLHGVWFQSVGRRS